MWETRRTHLEELSNWDKNLYERIITDWVLTNQTIDQIHLPFYSFFYLKLFPPPCHPARLLVRYVGVLGGLADSRTPSSPIVLLLDGSSQEVFVGLSNVSTQRQLTCLPIRSAQTLSVWDLCRVNKKCSTSRIKTCLHNPWCETLWYPDIKSIKIFQHIYLLVSTFRHCGLRANQIWLVLWSIYVWWLIWSKRQ